ncbi:hypothetical protein [Colwellia psychrerythraea]|uniref:Secreted protein n=1 Tax=Colwellia psychrerythraea TaxID=28229 RepID=A0A099L1T7_COLPS|nr:hypothetical protein [Colwellia psychrerythraea]KGJ96077.1 hypothetical protein GAB14E_0024 [Colwellia psychrerythraea]
MKITLLILVICLSTIIANASNADNTDEIKAGSLNKMKQDALAKIDVLACLNHGGMIKGVCMSNLPSCVQQYLDAGTKCSDSTKCAGECRIEHDFVKKDLPAEGYCSADNDPCGCFQLIKSGVAQAVLCAD